MEKKVYWLVVICFLLVNSTAGQKSESEVNNLRYDFYSEKCPEAETLVRFTMQRIFAQHDDAPAQLLRLLFHDCFVQGCDASVLLDTSDGNKSRSVERQALPNKTLKGFDKIDIIKEEIEKACPGVVSCADILVVAARDGIVLAGGPFYPVVTGRRDSTQSFFASAVAEIPHPDGNITETLRLFSLKGFSERETVALLGAHNIGKIGCEFILQRLNNFKQTGEPDPTITPDFLTELAFSCDKDSNNAEEEISEIVNMTRSVGISYFQALTSSVSSGAGFDAHYYQSLVRGRGLLFADQQLMANEKTAQVVLDYTSDDGTVFRMDFARVMVKLSNLGVLTGSHGHVRLNCSLPISSSD